MYGRELLKEGLMAKIGTGENTRVWTDKWLLDKVPRSPHYRQDAEVDLTLTVGDLMHPQGAGWNLQRIREIIAEEDISLILQTPSNVSRQDSVVWGLFKNGSYDSRSGYKLLETIQEINSPQPSGLPPLERRLWSNLWKTKTSPKIRHFLWSVLGGALAVKERLQTRGIHLDATCSICGKEQESICHVLFQCEVAKETWKSVLLNSVPQGALTNTLAVRRVF